ncbi:MAG: molybdenum cofactor guanylyltransferase [Syntrophotaleaceae bacterium]
MEFGSAVILAGGKSSRMGFDKQYLQVKNRYLLRHHEEVLSRAFAQLIVVTNTPDLYRDTSFLVVSDEIQGGGPLSGIHIGLKSAASRYVYLLACDMPNISLEYISFLQGQLKSSGMEACVTRFGNWIEPFNAFYSRDLLPSMELYLREGGKSIFQYLRSEKALYIPEQDARRFSPGWKMFLNLNSRKDFEAWQENILAGNASG